MSKTAFIRARVDPELKNEAELVLSELGVLSVNLRFFRH